ncbi:hypothetical protein ACV0NZ_001567 [Campylobacter jejuni]
MLKKEFDEKIKSLGLTRQDFCNMAGLAYSSVSNWNDNNKPIPIWVDSWLLNYEKAKVLDEISKSIKPFIK